MVMHFLIDDIEYNVIIEKKNNKNLYIRVDKDLNVKVSAPFLYTKKMIMGILKENEKSVIRMIKNQKKKNENEKDERYNLLGSKLNVLYKDVRRPAFTDNTLIVKDDKMLDNWFKREAKKVFKYYLDEAYYVFDEKIPYPKLKIRSMKTRWGVCNRRDNSVTLNLELIKKDKKYLNYVIVHELSHFVHFDHSKAFWKTVNKYCPEYKLVRKELKE